jgi:hypothetical protein
VARSLARTVGQPCAGGMYLDPGGPFDGLGLREALYSAAVPIQGAVLALLKSLKSRAPGHQRAAGSLRASVCSVLESPAATKGSSYPVQIAVGQAIAAPLLVPGKSWNPMSHANLPRALTGIPMGMGCRIGVCRGGPPADITRLCWTGLCV